MWTKTTMIKMKSMNKRESFHTLDIGFLIVVPIAIGTFLSSATCFEEPTCWLVAHLQQWVVAMNIYPDELIMRQ